MKVEGKQWQGEQGESSGGYQVRLEVFSGPLDLLLHLIKKNQVEIYDIPIARITAQYLEYLHALPELDLAAAGEFLVMAATLLEIKAKLLLPRQETGLNEESDAEEGEDPRRELVERLVVYQAVREFASHLEERAETWSRVFWRPLEAVLADREAMKKAGAEENDPDDAAAEASPLLQAQWSEAMLGAIPAQALWEAFQRVLERCARQERPRELPREEVTLRGQVGYLRRALKERERLRFEELFPAGATRVEIIVTFLALLELIRLRECRVRQEDLFGEIEIRRDGKGVSGPSVAMEKGEYGDESGNLGGDRSPAVHGHGAGGRGSLGNGA